MSIFSSAGLVLTILGLIEIISEREPAWARYVVLGSGLTLLGIAYLKHRRH